MRPFSYPWLENYCLAVYRYYVLDRYRLCYLKRRVNHSIEDRTHLKKDLKKELKIVLEE